MKVHSTRGAARVSAIWLVVVIVFLLVALGLAYSGMDEASRANTDRDLARQQLAEANRKAEESYKSAIEVSKLLGFYDPNVQNSLAQGPVATEKLGELKQAFEVPESAQNFEQVVTPLITKLKEKTDSIAELQKSNDDLRRQIEANDQAAQATARAQSDEIARLTKDLADERNGRAEDKTELERRVATITAARNSLDTELKATQGLLDDEKRARELDQQEHTTRSTHLASVLRFQREPDKADGEVLAISKTLGMAWIDLGAAQRISRGMEFRVESGNPTDEGHVKGQARVTDVEENRAEVMIYGQVDPLDPVVPGDKLFNPLYDREGGRNAVLIGRFSGIYNEKELGMLLDQVGIHVQPRIDRETDYLIVGAEIYVDENGEPLEEPIQPSDLPEYKQAESDGVQIVPIRDVIRYFKK